MKKYMLYVFSLICVLVCSCRKDEPQELLIGTWEVSQTTILMIADETDDNKVGSNEIDSGYYTFEESGVGRITLEDIVKEFTYQYLIEDSTIQFLLDEKLFIWSVTALTKTTFEFRRIVETDVFGIMTVRQEYVLNGKKL